MKLSLQIATASLPLLLLCGVAQAQAIKCTAPDGNVTYSNVACPGNTASERSVDTSGNTMDGSILRDQAQRDKAVAAQNQAKEQERATLEAGSRQQAQATATENAKSDEAAYANCRREVERTGAYAGDKARQIAMCLGADVKPEPTVVILRPTVRVSGPPHIATCTGNQCADDRGQRYFKQQGAALVREDGKFCQLAAGNTVRCP